jgi:hypothetical protein
VTRARAPRQLLRGLLPRAGVDAAMRRIAAPYWASGGFTTDEAGLGVFKARVRWGLPTDRPVLPQCFGRESPPAARARGVG